MDSIESPPRKKAVPLTEDGKKAMSVDYPYAEIRGFVRKTPEGGFLAGFSNWPEIEIYDKTGRQLRIIMLKTERASFEKGIIDSDASRHKIAEEIAERQFPSRKIHFISQYPEFLQDKPYYYNLIINDEGKMLVFYFPAEGDKPVYQTYSLDGNLTQEVVLDPGELELLLTPAAEGIVFYKGDLYALAEKNSAAGIRLRFVKCFLKLGRS
jgi:hypothetical protein